MLRALLLLGCLAIAAPASAQNCSNALQRAETSYQSGDFDNTIDRLTTCIEAGRFSDEERRKAYRLIGLSYIGKDREADARAAVAALLEVAPNYEPDPAVDPPPFVRMVSEMRRRRPGRTPAGSERVASTAKGFNASFRAHGMAYSDSDDDSVSGAGGDLTLGYAFSPALSVYANLSGSSGSNAPLNLSLSGVGLGGRFHINGGNAKLVPFVGAAASFQSATFTADGFTGSGDYSGAGGEVEGGLLYFFSPTLALDTGVSAAFAGLSNSTDEFSASIVRLGVGLSWRP